MTGVVGTQKPSSTEEVKVEAPSAIGKGCWGATSGAFHNCVVVESGFEKGWEVGSISGFFLGDLVMIYKALLCT